MHCVIGIDQSLTSTGVVVIEDGVPKPIDYKVINTTKDQTIQQRIWYITTQIHLIAHKYKPILINVEGLSFASSGNATRDLAGLYYSLTTVLPFSFGYNVQTITPNQVKKFATGKGRADKKEMWEALPDHIKEAFSLVKKTKGLYDVTDAYWLAKYTEDIIK